MALPKLGPCPMRHLRLLSERLEIVLASSSPRRQEFMRLSGVNFTVRTAEIDEVIYEGETPIAAARRLAREKCDTVAQANTSQNPRVTIGSDTIVWHNKRALGKPEDKANARRLLLLLNGATHTVFTGVSLRLDRPGSAPRHFTDCAWTSVTFNRLTDQQIDEYIATGDPLDKAGAYGAQELGAFLVDRIDGELDTVIGFPRALVDSLAEMILVSI